jgi:hypothetical protein
VQGGQPTLGDWEQEIKEERNPKDKASPLTLQTMFKENKNRTIFEPLIDKNSILRMNRRKNTRRK